MSTFISENVELILSIITLSTLGFTIYYKVTKQLTNGLLLYQPFPTDISRLREDFMDKKTKDDAIFAFTIFSLFTSILLSYFLNTIISKIFKKFGEFEYGHTLVFVLIIICFMCYIYFNSRCKNNRILKVELTKNNSKDKEEWFLFGRIDKDNYIFKKTNSKKIDSLKLLTQEQTINAYAGYVKANKK